MFNKQMGGRSGSASVSEAKGVLGETDRQTASSTRALPHCVAGTWCYLGCSKLPACKLFFECFIKILSLFGFHVVMSLGMYLGNCDKIM